MCGFIFVKSNIRLSFTKNYLLESLNLFNYRGPDDQGFYLDNDVFIGHNRLQILGSRDEGKQPSIINNTCLVFNGEIYNFKELSENYFPNQSFIFSILTLLTIWNQGVNNGCKNRHIHFDC